MSSKESKRRLSYPISDEIDPELARYLFEQHCAIIIVENLPVASEFGIDMSEFRTGDKFKGVKLIPPGIHFIHASSKDKKTLQSGPRCGFWHDFLPKEILIKRWSIQEEEFDESYCPSEDELNRYQSNLHDLDNYLGAYRFSTYRAYQNLTCKISSELVKQLMPFSATLRSVPYLTKDPNLTAHSSTVFSKRRLYRNSNISDTSLLPDLKPDEKTVIQFTKIPQTHIDQSIPHDKITKYYIDSTEKLENTFNDQLGLQRFLGEFQFAFVTFILFHIYECFEKWKEMLALVCLADAGIAKHPSFFYIIITTLRDQFNYIPADLFEGFDSDNNLLQVLLGTFIQNVVDLYMPKDFRVKIADLKTYLQEKYGWSLQVVKDDEKPVIVRSDEVDENFSFGDDGFDEFGF